MGALAPEELELALAAGADVVAWREASVEARRGPPETGGAAPVGPREARLGHGAAGHARPGRGRPRRGAVEAAPGLELAGAMTHFATADELGDDGFFFDEQLERFAAWAGALRRDRPRLVVHAANSAAALRDPPRTSTWSAAGSPSTGWTRSTRTRPRATWSPRSSSAPTSPTSSPARRARARATAAASSPRSRRSWRCCRSATATACGARLTNNADVLIGGRRYPLVGTVSMDNVTVDVGADPRVARGDLATLIGVDGAERVTAEDWARRPRHDQLRDHLRGERPGAAPAPPRMSAALDAARRALAGQPAWLVGGAIRDRLLGGAPVADDLDLALEGDVAAAAQAVASAGRADGVPAVRSLRRLARGGARPELAGRSGAARGPDDRGRPRPPRLHRQRDRRAARGRADPSTRPAACPTSRRAGCAWSPNARWPTTRCACCACAAGLRAGPRADPDTIDAARRAPPGSARSPPERVFSELQRIVAAPRRAPACG